jgi:phosphotriesterase-related protein
MATIETVTGPIDAGDLGTTLIHEHLVARDEAVHAQFPRAGTFGGIPERPIEPGNEYEAAVEAAEAAVDLGVESICDPTAMFLGRDVDFMRRVSEQTGLKVVACTGIYTYDHLPSFFVSRDPDQIAELFIADIEQGVQDSGIKAAFIKCAADEPGITENVEKIHRAAARTSLQTGAPIMAHSRPASDTGPKQVEIFESEGVNPAKVQIAHTGDTDDLDYIERLLDRGVYIGMDRYGLEMFLPVAQRDPTVLALLERGHAERMFLAADSCATLDWFPANVIEQLMAAGAAKDWDIRNVPAHALPRLREAGMTAEQERTMMVENPVRWLTGESV